MFIVAFLAGALTIINPCVLPILPILVTSAFSQSRLGPVSLASGVVISFSTVGFAALYFGHSLGGGAVMGKAAALILIVSGAWLASEKIQQVFSQALAPVAGGAGNLLTRISGDGLTGQFLVGVVLGGVWTPCVGPTLGAAIAAASTGENIASAWGTFAFFSLGVFASMCAFAYIMRTALKSHQRSLSLKSDLFRKIFGVALLIVGVALLTGMSARIEALFVAIAPDWLIAFTSRY